ncbi:MAG: hypothetical protein ACOCZJ_03045 [Thermoplasmatota archaeon]
MMTKNNKWIFVVLVVGILFLGVALSGCSDNGDDNGNGGSGDNGGNDIASASSIKYKWSVESDEGTNTWEYMAKDIGTDDLKVRINFEDTDEEYESVIINKELEKSWVKDDGQWQETPYSYVQQYENSLDDHLDRLAENWNNEPFEVTDPNTGNTLRWYGVEVDPSLSDSQFEV